MARFSSLSFLLVLAACHHRPAPPDGPSLELQPIELRHITAQPQSQPFDMVLDDSVSGERFLRARSLPVDPEADWLPWLEARMRATLEREKGVGLAAPQIGLSRRVILVQRQDRGSDPAAGPVELYLNVEVLEPGMVAESGWEGCLSVPAGFGEVLRPSAVRVSYDLPGGEHREEWVEGWTARIFQHETDHLDGVLFHDYVNGSLIPEDEYRALRAAERERPPPPQDTGAE
jgi:peptide deformylase